MSVSVTVRQANSKDADEIAKLHARCFARGWTAREFAALLIQDGVHAWVAATDDNAIDGFAVIRTVLDEAEILTVAVDPERRRGGIGRALLIHAFAELDKNGVARCFLEVAQDNDAALGLYRRLGFEVTGKRANYYANPSQGRVDAVTMTRIIAK
ncbi:MAG: ribosomal protein S18-alanine N-acetyltransferase [Rhodobacteraceae bacterium]|nr:ribosomal protein S18-alanine N-acetyltransferase [Paracoccaceae bacterium]